MKRKTVLISLATFGLLLSGLVGCGKTPASSDESKKPEESSQKSEESSQEGSKESSPLPASSSDAPVSSSVAPVSSSEAPVSSSEGPISSSEENPPLPATMNVSALEFTNQADDVMLVLKGSFANVPDASSFKAAFGLAITNQGGQGGQGSGVSFIYGKEKPAGADFEEYNYLAGEGKQFEVNINLSAAISTIVDFAPGVFAVYFGTEDTYARVNPVDPSQAASDKNYNFYIRDDQNAIAIDLIPDVDLAEVIVYKPSAEELPEGKTAGLYAKIGGKVKEGITDITAKSIDADFQRMNPYTVRAVEANECFWTVEGENAYANLYVGFMAVGERWMVHMGFDCPEQQNPWGGSSKNIPNCYISTKIEDEEYNFAEEYKAYTVHANKAAGQAGGDAEYYGCLGFAVSEPNGYLITFATTNCKVLVYSGEDFSEAGVETNYALSQDDQGKVVKYVAPDPETGVKEVKPEVCFKVVADEGYYADGNCIRISGTMGTEWNKLCSEDENIYSVTKIKANITITINAEEGTDAGTGYTMLVNTEHCTVVFYKGEKKNGVDDAYSAGKADSRTKKGAISKAKAQFNFEVFPEEGYAFDPVIEVGGESSPIGIPFIYGREVDQAPCYGNFKYVAYDEATGGYLFSITKVACHLTIDLICTPIVVS